MARFYLHLYNRIGFVRDEEGEELPDIAAACEQALQGIRSVLSEEARAGIIDLRGRIEITGAGGELLAVVPFREAVELLMEGEGE